MLYQTTPLIQNHPQFSRFIMAVEQHQDGYAIVRHELDDDYEPTGETAVVTTYRVADNAVNAVKHMQHYGELPSQFKASVRQTRRGEWLVVAALQNKYGIGIHRVGDPAPGYTTGNQYGRYANETDARQEAARLAVENDGIVVEWEYPHRNPQFADLPRQYPTRTEYTSFAEAEADGWIYITPSKTIEHYQGIVMFAQDITPGNASGYELALMIKYQGQLQSRRFATNQMIWAGGKFSYRFRMGDVVDAIEAARQLVDDLLSRNAPDPDPFCMPAINTGDYDVSGYESQFV